MSKERIFELIRKEEAVLFAGAGMSMYAGYPSGTHLAEIFYNELTNDVKQQIEFTTNLSKLSNDIYYLKGRSKNYMIEILKREYQKEPKSIEVHQLVAKIPQIKTIITTNYDTLFESTNKNIEVIRKSADCATANQKKQCLYKIHGDLTDTTNLILTNFDYQNYFVKEKEQSVFWNAVKTKLIENHIIFMGYSLDDSNIQIIIEKIISELGDHRKEMFFVAPSVSPAKLKFLQLNGIEYIQATAEELCKEIDEDLKNNYFLGLSKGIGSADTAFDFAKYNNIDIGLSKSRNFYIVDKLASLNGIQKNEVKFKIEGENESTKKLIDSINGKDFDDIQLNSDVLKEYSHFFNGIRINNQENISSIYIKKMPSISGMFNFVFEDGYELYNYYLEIFIARPSENQAKMKIKANDFEIILTIDFASNENDHKINIEIVPAKSIKSVKNGLIFYSILSRITANQKFKMFKENKLIYSYTKITMFEKNTFDAYYLFGYFNRLRKIENYFDVVFSEIKLKKGNEQKLNYIMAYIEKTTLEEDFHGITFSNDNKEEFEHILSMGEKETVLVLTEKEKSTFKLHGIDFTIGYLHKYVKDAYLDNLDDLKRDSSKKISMKSRSNMLYYHFSDDKTMITQ